MPPAGGIVFLTFLLYLFVGFIMKFVLWHPLDNFPWRSLPESSFYGSALYFTI